MSGNYFSRIFGVGRSICIGMAITLRYFIESLLFKKHTITVQYPREMDLIPERHRGIHFLETEKCIMCWKCADICPVDCIYIEGVRGVDGPLTGGWRGKKATLSKFTVDYTVCIFCGLCEEPCPTQCIHLGPEFDYHATDRRMMEKNLLTDEVYTEEDEKFVQWAREENERLQKVRTEKAAAAKAPEAKAPEAKAPEAKAPAAEKEEPAPEKQPDPAPMAVAANPGTGGPGKEPRKKKGGGKKSGGKKAAARKAEDTEK